MDAADAPFGRKAPSAHDRTERDYELQEPDDFGSGICEHHWTSTLRHCRSEYRRSGRRAWARNAMARFIALGYLAPPNHSSRAINMDASSARRALFCRITSRAVAP